MCDNILVKKLTKSRLKSLDERKACIMNQTHIICKQYSSSTSLQFKTTCSEIERDMSRELNRYDTYNQETYT